VANPKIKIRKMKQKKGFDINLVVTPFYLVLIFNVLMMAEIMSRMAPSTALVTSIPDMQDRGAFMSINSSLQQIAGGIAAAFAGTIVVQRDKTSPLEHYGTLGIIIIFVLILSLLLMFRVDKLVKKKAKQNIANF
jgi:predicted MFS family arabinose efflux permease